MSTFLTLAEVPENVRIAVEGSSAFRELLESYTREHVLTSVSTLIARLQDSGMFADDLDALVGIPNYVAELKNNDIELVELSGYWYSFDWKDLSTFPVDVESMKFGLDLKRFADDQGLRLQDWCWDEDADRPIYSPQITEESRPHIFDVIAKQTMLFDLSDLVPVLVEVAQHEGKKDLADAIHECVDCRNLFEAYLVKDDDFALDRYSSEADAAKAACEQYNITVDRPEVYNYWNVSERLSSLLQEEGEAVADDFMGSLRVWARTTSGQSIAMDEEIHRIVIKDCEEEIDALIRTQFPELARDAGPKVASHSFGNGTSNDASNSI